MVDSIYRGGRLLRAAEDTLETIGVGSLLACFGVKRILERVLGFGVTLGVCLGGLRLVSVLRVLRGW